MWKVLKTWLDLSPILTTQHKKCSKCDIAGSSIIVMSNHKKSQDVVYNTKSKNKTLLRGIGSNFRGKHVVTTRAMWISKSMQAL